MVDRELLMQAGVSAKDVERLDQAWNALQAATDRDASHTPYVVCTGIYNAGKSTLLNALLGENIFPTGDVPTTKAVARAEHGGAVYIDTPGLNAEEEDDQETLTAYESADFILFVSNAQNGGISATEAGWLKRLGERYTVDSLKQRLIYVLSHSAQVEPEELPGIEAHARGDLEKTVGFVLEQIFCVDSILFQQGRGQEEAIMMEDSGIPVLQGYLAERIAGAEDTLRQAHETELAQRRRDLSETLDGVRLMVQQTYDAQCGQVRAKVAEVDAAWREFERVLEQAMPEKTVHPIQGPVSFPLDGKGEIGEARSETEARRRYRDYVRTYYDNRNKAVEEGVNRLMRSVRRTYCSGGLNSAYTQTVDMVNRAIESGILSLQKLGTTVAANEGIVIEASLPPDLGDQVRAELMDKVVQDGMLDYYVNQGDMVHYDCPEKGLFGYHDVRKYYVRGNASKEIKADLKEGLEDNIRYANNLINEYWGKFCRSLEEAVARRKSALKAQVDAYKESIGGVPPDVEKALAHLLTLKEAAPL